MHDLYMENFLYNERSQNSLFPPKIYHIRSMNLFELDYRQFFARKTSGTLFELRIQSRIGLSI